VGEVRVTTEVHRGRLAARVDGREISERLLRRPLLPVGLGVVLFSTGPVMVAGSSVSGPVLSFWRLVIGAAVMGALTLGWTKVSGRRPDAIGWRWAARCGVAFGLHQLFFVVAIKTTSVVDVTLMQVLQPILVGALAAILFGERPGIRFRLWSLVAIIGAAVVVLGGAAGPEGDPAGIALAVVNVAFFALYFVWSKQARDHIDTVPFLFGVVATAAVVVAATLAVGSQPVTAISSRDLLVAAYIAIVPGAVGHFVTIWPLPRVPANVPAVMQLAMPFLAGGLAWLVLGQPITALHVVGGLVTIVGVAGSLLSPGGKDVVEGGPDPTIVPGD
jgi:drug/metabolite transporter (DMT)-like permease